MFSEAGQQQAFLTAPPIMPLMPPLLLPSAICRSSPPPSAIFELPNVRDVAGSDAAAATAAYAATSVDATTVAASSAANDAKAVVASSSAVLPAMMGLMPPVHDALVAAAVPTTKAAMDTTGLLKRRQPQYLNNDHDILSARIRVREDEQADKQERSHKRKLSNR
jgi:hypothetical protein